MNELKIGLTTITLFTFLIIGFLSNYILLLLGLFLALSTLIVLLIVKSKKGLDFMLFLILIVGIVFAFHSGLIIRNSFQKVCFISDLKNRTENKFNIKPIDLNQIEHDILQNADCFNLVTLTTIESGDSIVNLNILKSIDTCRNKPKILIIAGVHGSEPSGVYAIKEIIHKIKVENLLQFFNIQIIYALNPIGLAMYNRNNECNCDINRDYIQFKTMQSKLIKKLCYLNKYNYVLDLHEGPYNGHYFINNTSLKGLESRLTSKLKENNIIISPLLQNGIRNFLFKYQLDSPTTRLNKIMPLDNYLNSIGIENILSESNPLSNNMEHRILGHVITFDCLINSLNK
ncbi:MAG: DUF2817 domain-containing protein [Salinivirgaceae bacterium]|nr:DUF2817 domain-containing protein [Salinivirgaceae bacterium]